MQSTSSRILAHLGLIQQDVLIDYIFVVEGIDYILCGHGFKIYLKAWFSQLASAADASKLSTRHLA
jgi:hypothetical protein